MKFPNVLDLPLHVVLSHRRVESRTGKGHCEFEVTVVGANSGGTTLYGVHPLPLVAEAVREAVGRFVMQLGQPSGQRTARRPKPAAMSAAAESRRAEDELEAATARALEIWQSRHGEGDEP